MASLMPLLKSISAWKVSLCWLVVVVDGTTVLVFDPFPLCVVCSESSTAQALQSGGVYEDLGEGRSSAYFSVKGRLDRLIQVIY